MAIEYGRDLAPNYAALTLGDLPNDIGCTYLYGIVSNHSKNSQIIDIGCGDGRDLEELFKLGYTNLTGIEPSEAFLKAAQKRQIGAHIKEGHFEDIPVQNKTIDVAISRYSMMLTDNLSRAFTEVSRVLKPQGVLYAVVSHPDFDKKIGADKNGFVRKSLYGGRVIVEDRLHTLNDYQRSAQNAGMSFEIVREYHDQNTDSDFPGEINAICYRAMKLA